MVKMGRDTAETTNTDGREETQGGRRAGKGRGPFQQMCLMRLTVLCCGLKADLLIFRFGKRCELSHHNRSWVKIFVARFELDNLSIRFGILWP
jgi:hypothetical protein